MLVHDALPTRERSRAMLVIILGITRSHLETGLLATAAPLGIVGTAPFVGRLIGLYSGGVLGGIGLGVLSLGLLPLGLLPTEPSNLDIIWRMALCGIGFGLFRSPYNHIILTSASTHRSGGASGMLGTARLTRQTLDDVLLAIIFGLFDAKNIQGSLVALWPGAAFAGAAAAAAACVSALRCGRNRLGCFRPKSHEWP